jgi:hypothetical protein
MQARTRQDRMTANNKTAHFKFNKMKTIENPGIDYTMIAIVAFYIVFHFMYGLI